MKQPRISLEHERRPRLVQRRSDPERPPALVATESKTRAQEDVLGDDLGLLAARIGFWSPALYPGPWIVRDRDGRHVATIRNGAIYRFPILKGART